MSITGRYSGRPTVQAPSHSIASASMFQHTRAASIDSSVELGPESLGAVFGAVWGRFA